MKIFTLSIYLCSDCSSKELFVCLLAIALQPQLVPLLGKLIDQQESIFQLLANLEQKVQLRLIQLSSKVPAAAFNSRLALRQP